METIAVAPHSGFVYVASFGGYFKIGRTKDSQVRLRQLLSVKFPEAPILKLSIAVAHASKAERALHLKYQDKRAAGEWFELTEADLPEIETFLNTGEYLTFPPKPTKVAKLKQEIKTTRAVKPALSVREQWTRKVDLVPKPGLKELPRLLREITEEIGAITFAYYPYKFDDASKALGKIARRNGYNLTVIWDGPFNSAVFKLPPGKDLFGNPTKHSNGNGHK